MENNNDVTIKEDEEEEEEIIPRPEDLRTTPLANFMGIAVDTIRNEYKDSKDYCIQIRVPKSSVLQPDVIRKVAKILASQGWDVMIIGSFQLMEERTQSIDGLLANMDSAQFFVVSPSTDPIGMLIPNENKWKIIDGELIYNSKHAVLKDLQKPEWRICPLV